VVSAAKPSALGAPGARSGGQNGKMCGEAEFLMIFGVASMYIPLDL